MSDELEAIKALVGEYETSIKSIAEMSIPYCFGNEIANAMRDIARDTMKSGNIDRAIESAYAIGWKEAKGESNREARGCY